MLMPYEFTTPEGVLKAIKDDKIAMVDLRFTDLPGLWQHFSCLLYTSDAADE